MASVAASGDSKVDEDQVVIKSVLAHLGLHPPEEPKPPPALHEVIRVPVDEEGREMQGALEDRQADNAARFPLTTSREGE